MCELDSSHTKGKVLLLSPPKGREGETESSIQAISSPGGGSTLIKQKRKAWRTLIIPFLHRGSVAPHLNHSGAPSSSWSTLRWRQFRSLPGKGIPIGPVGSQVLTGTASSQRTGANLPTPPHLLLSVGWYLLHFSEDTEL